MIVPGDVLYAYCGGSGGPDSCAATNNVIAAVGEITFAVLVVGYPFWRFRWWPISRLRAWNERQDAKTEAYIAARRAEEAAALPPSEDDVWSSFGPDD